MSKGTISYYQRVLKIHGISVRNQWHTHQRLCLQSKKYDRESYLARKEKHGDEEKSMGGMKKLVQSWKTENKSIYRNKVVRNLFFKAFPRIYRSVYLDYFI